MNLSRARFKRYAGLYLMLLPGIVYFLVFHYAPMGGLAVAFKDFRMNLGILDSPWCGLDNFQRLFSSPDFPRALMNTLTISFLRLVVGFFAPVALALMLNEVRISAYKRAVQTVTYMPYFFSWVVLGGIFAMLFSSEGPVNAMVTALGGDPVTFLTSDGWFLTILIVTGIWQTVGYGSVIYLAALAGISPTLYEAAMVDGAGRWRQTLHITIPSLIPTMVTLLVLSLGQILNAGFDQIYNMQTPLVYDVSDIIGTYVLRRLTTMDVGLATAADMFKSVVGLILVVGVNAFAKRVSGGEQGVW